MAITQDGLSQLLSSYASDESEGSSSEKEDSTRKENQTIESVKVNPQKLDDAGREVQRLVRVIQSLLASVVVYKTSVTTYRPHAEETVVGRSER